MRQFNAKELDLIVAHCRKHEYTCFISFFSDQVRVCLEKGSSYGKMHMKFEAEGDTASAAFEKCVLNFPANPVGAVWDTKRIEAHHTTPIDAAFTEAE